MKRWLVLFMTFMLSVAAFGGTARALSDLDNIAGKDKILSLQQRGIVDGIDDEHFQPQSDISYAQAVHMIVKGLRLNIDHLQFVKEPQASDYFTKIPDDAWYARSYVIAHLNGLPLPKDVTPDASMTREQYADLLMQAVMTKGDYAFIELYVTMADEQDVDKAYMNSIQKLLIAHIASLDQERKFYPKKAMTRADAAVWLYNAIEFVERMSGGVKPPADNPDQPQQDDQVTMQVEKITDEVNKVTLSWGKKPNSGYRIEILAIDFDDTGTAHIVYDLKYPEPDKNYSTVITEPKAVTYVSAKYKPIAKIAEKR